MFSSRLLTIKLSLPILVGLALPLTARYVAQWLGHPDWRIPLIFGFLIGSFLTAVYFLPSASALQKSIESSQRVHDALLRELNQDEPKVH